MEFRNKMNIFRMKNKKALQARFTGSSTQYGTGDVGLKKARNAVAYKEDLPESWLESKGSFRSSSLCFKPNQEASTQFLTNIEFCQQILLEVFPN